MTPNYFCIPFGQSALMLLNEVGADNPMITRYRAQLAWLGSEPEAHTIRGITRPPFETFIRRNEIGASAWRAFRW